jgi:hypothetical protein
VTLSSNVQTLAQQNRGSPTSLNRKILGVFSRGKNSTRTGLELFHDEGCVFDVSAAIGG